MVLVKKGNMGNRIYGGIVYVQVRNISYSRESADRMGLLRVINFAGIGDMDGMGMELQGLLDGVGRSFGSVCFMEVKEVSVMKRNDLLGIDIRDGILTIASVLVFRDEVSLNMYVLGNMGLYTGSDVMYGIMN